MRVTQLLLLLLLPLLPTKVNGSPLSLLGGFHVAFQRVARGNNAHPTWNGRLVFCFLCLVRGVQPDAQLKIAKPNEKSLLTRFQRTSQTSLGFFYLERAFPSELDFCKSGRDHSLILPPPSPPPPLPPFEKENQSECSLGRIADPRKISFFF